MERIFTNTQVYEYSVDYEVHRTVFLPVFRGKLWNDATLFYHQ